MKRLLTYIMECATVSLLLFCVGTLLGKAQPVGSLPTANPIMTIETPEGPENTEDYAGRGPVKALFSANVRNVGNYTAHYEWRVFEGEEKNAPYLVRHEANFNYVFSSPGTYFVTLTVSFTLEDEIINYEEPSPFIVLVEEFPTANPTMIIETPDGPSDETEYTGSAPIAAHFSANIRNADGYTPLYEWFIYEAGKEDKPYLTRREAEFDYEFVRSGSSCIKLYISFVQGTDTIEYELEEPFKVTAGESVLNVPNAFSPNDDGQNDVFRVKEDHKSIIEFHGYIFNRWGKKLFEWRDINDGWDGRYGGSNVADGVYFCRIDAKGADGRVYKIRKAVTLVRGYKESSRGVE